MRMKLLVCATTILLAGTAWAQQMCPDPNTCAGCNLPIECCQPVGGQLVYECANKPPNFVLVRENGTEVSLTAVSGVAGFSLPTPFLVNNLVIGNGTFAPPPFTIGDSATNARFVTSLGGKCEAVGSFKGLVVPSPITVNGRALTVSKSNPFFCRDPDRDTLCFQVKGQVGAPFPNLAACTPDRVEYACGKVN